MSSQNVHNAHFVSCYKRSTVSINVLCITKHRSRFRHEFRACQPLARNRPTSFGDVCSLPSTTSPCPGYPVLHLATNTETPQPQTHLTSTNEPPSPTNNHPEESQLRTASASSPLRAYSLTSLSPTDAGPGRRNHVESQEQRHHTKRSLIRHPRARCRYRASRHPPLREIAVPPDLQRTTGKP
jgi:hypothetical protein